MLVIVDSAAAPHSVPQRLQQAGTGMPSVSNRSILVQTVCFLSPYLAGACARVSLLAYGP